MKRSTITITFKEDWDAEAIEQIVKRFATTSAIDKIHRKVFFKGSSERGQEFVRACEAIEPIISFTIKTTCHRD